MNFHQNPHLKSIVVLAGIVAFTGAPAAAADDIPLDTTMKFSASGLKQGGERLNGRYDITLQLYDAEADGNAIGQPFIFDDIRIRNGKLAEKRVDFGPGAVNGTSRWVEISARPDDSTGAYVETNRRYPLHVGPIALSLPGFYTIPTGFTPHVIGGWHANGVTNDADYGVTISGGGSETTPNIGLNSFATISGGSGNRAGAYGSVGGGYRNLASGNHAVVPGGWRNRASGDYSFAAGFEAHADHHGSVAFNCDYNNEFFSGGEKQFLVRAPGGVGVNIARPHAALDVYTLVDNPSNVGIRVVVPNSGYWMHQWFDADINQIGGLGMANTGKIVMDNDITVNGAALLSDDGTWSRSSDRRLKTDIESLDGLLDKALKLRPVSYRWRSGGDNDLDVGFIAQEVQEVFPSLVHEGDHLTLDYSGLSVAAIGAIQELAQENESMRDEIAELRAMVLALSNAVESK